MNQNNDNWKALFNLVCFALTGIGILILWILRKGIWDSPHIEGVRAS